MIKVIIYVEQSIDPNDLVNNLLKEKLIANASIDFDNVSYRLENEAIVKSVYSVITAQTKALLFDEIEKYIHKTYGLHVPIYSVSIKEANILFEALIKQSTKKV